MPSKLFFFILNLTLIEVCQAQCYPVDLTQTEQSMVAGQDQGTLTNLFYTYSREDIGNGVMKLTYHVFENGVWTDLNPIITHAIPSLSKWENIYIVWGSIYEFNGKQAPNDSVFAFIQFKNGVWEALPGGLKHQNNSNILADCTDKDLWQIEYPYSYNGNTSIFKYDLDSGKFIEKAVIRGKLDQYVRFQAGKNRVLLSNIGEVNGDYTDGFAYFQNDSLFINNQVIAYEHSVYGINRRNDEIVVIQDMSSPEVSILDINGDINSIITNYQIPDWDEDGTVGCVVVNDKIVWTKYGQQTDNQGGFWDKKIHTLVLCGGETEWKIITHNFNDWGPMMAYQNKMYRLNRANNFTYELGNGVCLQGRLYADKNDNCNLDNGEDVYLKNQTVVINPPGSIVKQYVRTNDSGKYFAFVVKDTIIVKTTLQTADCMNDTVSVNSDSVDHNIAVKLPTDINIKAEIVSNNRLRWNDKSQVGLRISNLGAPVDSVNIQFVCQFGIDIKSDKIKLRRINSTVLEASIYHLDYYETQLLSFEVSTDTANCKPGDKRKLKVSIKTMQTETDLSDNSDSVNYMIVYSYDPNIKTCKQERIPVKTGKRLDYFIEFQNEGNDDAYEVVIVDTLPSSLLPSTLILNEGSHAYRATLRDNVLRIVFADIDLKHKKENEALSKGFISFSLECITTLNEGDKIQNLAYIYFDLNKPVITNKAVTEISNTPLSIHHSQFVFETLKVFPNPSNESINISGEETNVSIYDMQGVLVKSARLENGQLTVRIADWSNGIYYIKTANGSVMFLKMD